VTRTIPIILNAHSPVSGAGIALAPGTYNNTGKWKQLKIFLK